jgi:hypothetical protein
LSPACLLGLGLFITLASTSRADFVLRDGDRVVLLGSTLIEHERLYGYWEAMFVSHFPRSNVVFRNLGHGGDTVWGEPRAGSETDHDGSQALADRVASFKPTLILVAYGAEESRAGQAGLARFKAGLARLLDRLASTRARIVLLAPLRLESLPALPDPAAANTRLWHYVDVLHEEAIGRDYLFLDLERWLAPVRQASMKPFWTDDGSQLNQLGYWITSAALENDLQLRPSGWKLELGAAGPPLNLSGATLDRFERSAEKLAFRLRSTTLPLTAPVRKPGHTGQLTVQGLASGRHALTIDGRRVAEASAGDWQQGVALDCPAELEQLEALRRAIVRKNALFFKGEQAQSAAQRGRFARLVAEQEAEIVGLREPLPHRFELVREQPESQP